MSDESEHLPIAIATGELRLGDMVIPVHVLDDGRRVIEAEWMEKAMDYLADQLGLPATERETQE